MQRSIALALLLAIALAPPTTSAARNLNQWRTRRGSSGFGGFQWPSSFGSYPSTTTSSSPSTTTSSPSTTTSPTTTTSSPTTTSLADTTASPTTTTTSPTTTTTSPTSSSSGPSSSVLDDVLSLHNSLRSKHSASPLTWSSSLASSAQSWSANCNFAHSGRSGVGENIVMGQRTFTDAVNDWYNEVSQYNFNNPGYTSGTGHFTQIVWKGTTQLGCGYTECGSSRTLYVCQYSPQGNIMGQFQANVS